MPSTKKVLGVRCSNTDFAFAVLSGTKQHPQIEDKRCITFPKGRGRPQQLNWLFLEVQDLFRRHNISAVMVKGAEPLVRKSQSLTERIEAEAIVFLVTANANFDIKVARTIRKTIAKSLLGKGEPKLLDSQLDTSHFPDFNKENDKIQEAVLAAWSSL